MATYTVTTSADSNNNADGVLSLREAIFEANNNPGTDTIVFASNLSGSTITLNNDLDITDSDGFRADCEHGKAPDAAVLKWQNRLNPAWRKFAGGCNMNRDIPALLGSAGFHIKSDQRDYIPGAKILCYNYWGIAVAAGGTSCNNSRLRISRSTLRIA